MNTTDYLLDRYRGPRGYSGPTGPMGGGVEDISLGYTQTLKGRVLKYRVKQFGYWSEWQWLEEIKHER